MKRLVNKLLPIEKVVVFFLLGALLLYYSIGIPYRYPKQLYLDRLASSAFFYGLGVLCCFLLACLGDVRYRLHTKLPVRLKITWENFRHHYLDPHKLLIHLRIVNAVAMMFTVFLNMKHLIPFINSNIYDSVLADVDRALFSGRLASEWFQSLLGANMAMLLSDIYVFFYPFIAVTLYVVMLGAKERDMHEFFSAFALLWFTGLLVVYTFPTMGPVFFFRENLPQLPYTEVTELQRSLWLHKSFVEQDPTSSRGFYLISGLPSLHIAAPLLISIFLGRVSSVIACFSWVFVFLTVVTTLYFGWHYLMDDVAAVLLVWVVLLVNRQLFYLNE